MKISKIKISKFYQFEDFELDLTYPKGHEKAGEPLDKVCFIGQSGTGKTTLLEMVRQAVLYSEFPSRYNYKELKFENKKGIGAGFYFKGETFEKDFYISIDAIGAGMNKELGKPIVNSLFYFSAGIAQANLDDDFIKLNMEDLTLKEPDMNYKVNRKGVEYYPITPGTIQVLWDGFYSFIREYQNDEATFRINLTHQIEKGGVDVVKELEKWRKENPNPLESVAKECLDSLLNRFHLAVQTIISDTRKINVLQIRSLSDNSTIPYESLSTGTKQIIYTAFPIYQLLQDDSIVLMDEPETSLYPDIQREIIPYYTSFDKEKKSQFFFATHSPIIASAFEPWEIVELKFDSNGKVYRDKYYEGENQVDNYKIDPRYLRWDAILTQVFDLPVDSNAEYRAELLTKYSMLKNKINKLEKEGNLTNPDKDTRQTIKDFQRADELLTGSWAETRHEKN